MAMTEYTFSRGQCPDMLRCDTAASTTEAVQVNIPVYARRVTISSEAGRGCLVSLFSDSDNIHSDHLKVKSYGSIELEWFDGVGAANGISAIYVANKISDSAVSRKFTVVIEGAD